MWLLRVVSIVTLGLGLGTAAKMIEAGEVSALCNPYLVAFEAYSVEDLAAQINAAFPNGVNIKEISTHGGQRDAWNEEHFALIQVCEN